MAGRIGEHAEASLAGLELRLRRTGGDERLRRLVEVVDHELGTGRTAESSRYAASVPFRGRAAAT